MKLKHNHRFVEGYIEHTKCTNCSCELHNFIFSGDTDMATSGFVALIKPDSKEIAIIETTDYEWNGHRIDLMNQRVNAALNSSGFSVIEYDHFINNKSRKNGFPNVPFVVKTLKIERLKISDFKDSGGKFHML